ncbi:unnamed protein product, partial [Didymodactylos carnosus]
MPDPGKIRGLLDTKPPTTSKEAYRFVKAAEYYRKFIPHFSQIAIPLYKYAPNTSNNGKRIKSEKIVFSDIDLQAFNHLKQILTADLILRIPNETRPFKLQTDASDIGIGAVLMQTYPNGDLPVAYFSQKLSSTQTKWSTTEKECYAILAAIEKWHKYLDGREFVLETDHKPLVQLNVKAQINAKCERWRLKLQQYRFSLKYIKGHENTMADYLSRSPVDDPCEDPDEYPEIYSKSTQTDSNDSLCQPILAVITRSAAKKEQPQQAPTNLHTSVDGTLDSSEDVQVQSPRIPVDGSDEQVRQAVSKENVNRIIPFTLDDIREQQKLEPLVQQIVNNIAAHKHYFITDGILMRQQSHPLPSVPFVPKGRLRADILTIYHDTPANGAHFGRDKTIRRIQERYFWPSMLRDIRNHIQSCVPCCQNNHQRRKAPGSLKPIKPPEGVWQLLSMDFHGP